MISTSRPEALGAARRLIRGFASAPDTRRHAQQFYGALVHAKGWSRDEEDMIVALGNWLSERPNVNELKKRCEAMLEAFD